MWKLKQARFATIGRVRRIQPVMQELYFLRTLMSSNHSARQKSFEDVRNVLDVPYDTYRKHVWIFVLWTMTMNGIWS
jgi:hypothetical protein